MLFIKAPVKAEAFVVLGHLLQVSCPLTTFSSPQRLRDYDALHRKRYDLPIHYHALSLMCDRFGIFLFFVALPILRSAARAHAAAAESPVTESPITISGPPGPSAVG